MTTPILVTGGSGQLATALAEAGPMPGLTVYRVGRPTLDFDQPASIAAAFAASAPSLVVNAAAYTAVDAAEDDADAAFRANRDGPAELARLCETAGIPLIHVSTDYVFDGLKGAPYVETDPTGPQGVYGASKLAGEDAALATCSRAIVLRTSWVFSPTGTNFVRTMLAAGQRNSRLRVVADQTGCPTSAPDLAEAILSLAGRLMSGGWEDRYAGIYHAAGTGAATWHALALATFDAAARHGMATPTVAPITTDEWPTRAKRPPDSRLDCGKLADVFGLRLPPWRDGLVRTVDAIFARAG
ncbi:MAG TPA: dTDP-4-dehydrorhamnose reductase [Acetobacteraceae bacterium]|nr:dTDP-4-dehydrorhamnose reductase [Acetobacteraceae bacterium]